MRLKTLNLPVGQVPARHIHQSPEIDDKYTSI